MRRLVFFSIFLGLIIIGAAWYIIAQLPDTAPQNQKQKPLSEPVVRITDPQRGLADAPLTIVFYTDFACDSCTAVWPMIQAAEQDVSLKNKVRFVWKDFPAHQNVYPESLILHKAAHCAAAQGKFWEFQEAAFNHNQEVRSEQSVLSTVISEARLNPATLQTCINSPAIADIIQANFDEGVALGLTGTPTFYIGKKRIDGNLPYPAFVGQIRNELSRGQTPR